MNYTALSAQIIATTQNNDATFVASVPLFIQTAEVRIHTEAALPSARTTTAVGSTTIGSRALTMPVGSLSILGIELATPTGQMNLVPKAAEYLNEMYPVLTTQAQPKYYAWNSGTGVLIAPTPDQAYVTTFHTMAVPTSITTANNTWLGDNFPHVLLYVALVEAYVFMKGEADVMKYYQDLAMLGITEIKNTTARSMIMPFRSA